MHDFHDFEEREELRREVAATIEWLARRWMHRGEGQWKDLVTQYLFLAREHARFFSGEMGANREHHELHALRNLLSVAMIALERMDV